MAEASSFHVEEAGTRSRAPSGTPPKKTTFSDVYNTGVRKSLVTFDKNGGEMQEKFKSAIALENPEDDVEGLLTVSTATFNLANNIIGAGLVGLSFVATGAGVIPFLILLTGAAICSTVTLDMLSAAGEMAGWKDYERCGISAIGNLGKWITAFGVCANCYGACIAYIKLIDSTAPVVGKVMDFEIEPVILQVAIAVLVVFPLCCLRNLSALASSAMFALAVYMAVTMFTIYSAFTDTWYADVGIVGGNLACPAEAPKIIGDSLISIIRNFPTIIFAFVCHMTALPVFAELKVSTYTEMQKVNRYSILTSYLIYFGVGLSGYLAFSNNTFSSVLMNLRHCVCTEFTGDRCASGCAKHECADDNIMASILNVCFLLAVITGYPSVHFSLRKSLIAVFFDDEAEFSWNIHIGIAAVNVALTLGIAILASDISIVFNWAGSIASPLVAFVLPSLFFFKLMQRKNDIKYSPLSAVMGMGLFGFGCVVVVVGVSLQLFA